MGKDIEKCFGILQATFFCLWVESKLWYLEQVMEQSQAFLILQKMIVKIGKEGNVDKGVGEDGHPFDVSQKPLSCEDEESGSGRR